MWNKSILFWASKYSTEKSFYTGTYPRLNIQLWITDWNNLIMEYTRLGKLNKCVLRSERAQANDGRRTPSSEVLAVGCARMAASVSFSLAPRLLLSNGLSLGIYTHPQVVREHKPAIPLLH